MSKGIKRKWFLTGIANRWETNGRIIQSPSKWGGPALRLQEGVYLFEKENAQPQK